LDACGLQFGHSFVKRVLLYIGQNQVHTQLGANAGALQAKARACASEDSSLLFEIGDHAFAFFKM
jgi:hypothetical protein